MAAGDHLKNIARAAAPVAAPVAAAVIVIPAKIAEVREGNERKRCQHKQRGLCP